MSNRDWDKAKRRAMQRRGYEIATMSTQEASALVRLVSEPIPPAMSKADMRSIAATYKGPIKRLSPQKSGK